MKLSFLRSSLCILHFFLSLKLLDFSFNFIQKLVSFENIVLVEALLDVLKVAGDIFERVKEVCLLILKIFYFDFFLGVWVEDDDMHAQLLNGKNINGFLKISLMD
ncbi:hypothetical protein ACOSQ2_005205 [Xanthoceras sorbifolium]